MDSPLTLSIVNINVSGADRIMEILHVSTASRHWTQPRIPTLRIRNVPRICSRSHSIQRLQNANEIDLVFSPEAPRTTIRKWIRCCWMLPCLANKQVLN